MTAAPFTTSTALKTLLYGVLGLGVGVLLVAVSPLVTLYFLFDRFCGLIEEIAPSKSRKRKRQRGGWLKQIPSLLKLSTGNAKPHHKTGGQDVP